MKKEKNEVTNWVVNPRTKEGTITKARFVEDDVIARHDLEKLRLKKLGFWGRLKEKWLN